jgi:dihydroxyacetone kinase phosphotransfer subunit
MPVSLVIVSHSALLAEGVREIACQMAGDAIRIAACGGLRTGDGSAALGTDAVPIAEAVRSLWSPDGVLLLVDMGSAVLSAEVALDMLEPDERSRCLISNAPLVEGAIVAAIEAGLGRSLEEVNSAAEGACTLPKR